MSSFRVFVSSTFKNFQYERDYLSQNMYKALDDFSKREGLGFHAIDLRWGISNEASKDNKSMILCLEEIKKCQAADIKPNFLVMLGDYYGWRPLPYSIPEDEGRLLFRMMDNESRELFNQYYWLDENAVPSKFILQGRSHLSDLEWNVIEKKLHDALERAACEVLETSQQDKYIYSATHQEILMGLLNDGVAKDYTFAFIKEEGDIYGDTEDYNRARRLKEIVLSTLPESQYAVFSNDEEFVVAEEKAEKFLKSVIKQQIESLSEVDSQLTYLEKLNNNYISNTEFEEGLLSKINLSKGEKIYLISEQYGGKSSLMYRLHGKLSNSRLWCANSDIDHQSIKQLCRYIIKTVSNGKINPPIEADNACYLVQKYLSEYNIKETYDDEEKKSLRYVFLLDSIDTLSDYHLLQDMIFDIALPLNIVFVFSLSTNPRDVDNSDIVCIPQMTSSQKEQLFSGILFSNNRRLADKQYEDLIPLVQKGNPMFVRLLATKALGIHSYDSIVFNCNNPVDLLQGDIRLMSSPLFYGDILIQHVLLYIAFSKYGISEEELLELLKNDNQVVNHLKSTAHWDFDESIGIPKAFLYRILSDFNSYIYELNGKGEIIYRFVTDEIAQIVITSFQKSEVESLYKFYKNFFKAKDVYLNARKKANQRIVKQLILIAMQDENDCKELLSSVFFCDACIKIGEADFLSEIFRERNLTDAEIYKVLHHHFSQLLVFQEMFLPYYVSDTGNVIEGVDYFSRVEGNEEIQIANWTNDKIEFAYQISESEYIITYENVLAKIHTERQEIIQKIVFRSRLEKCCLSPDGTTLTIVCSPIYNLNLVEIPVYQIDIKSYRIIHSIKITNKENEFITNPRIYRLINGDHVLILTCSNDDSFKAFGRNTYRAYRISTNDYKELFSITSWYYEYALIASRYILFTSIKEVEIYDVETCSFIYKSKSIKHLGIKANNVYSKRDGDTYCYVDGKGLYKINIVSGNIKLKKEFTLLNNSSTFDYFLAFLEEVFLVKYNSQSFADVYSFHGTHLGTVNWDGATYLLNIARDTLTFVHRGGALYSEKLNNRYVFNLNKVHLSISEIYRNGISAFKKIRNAFNTFDSEINNMQIYSMSCDGRYIARLTKHGLSVTENGKEVLSYIHKSKKFYERDIKFISETELLWKMTERKIKLFNLKDRKNSTIYKSQKRAQAFLCGNELFLVFQKRHYEQDYNKIKKMTMRAQNSFTEVVDTSLCRTPEYTLRQFRKSRAAKLLFSYTIPAQLLLEESTSDVYESMMSTPLKNDSIILLNNNIVIKHNNRTLYVYTYNGDNALKASYALYNHLDADNSKAEIIEDRCYCYLPKLKLVMVYNMKTKQKMQYLLTKDTKEVVFQDHKIVMLRDNNRKDTLHILDGEQDTRS